MNSQGTGELAQELTTLRGELERRRAEQMELQERLERSLGHQQALLRDLHHRVKNNMQVVSGMLNLQAAKAPPAAAEVLRASAARVHVFARIHERLSLAGNYARIDCQRLTADIVSDVQRANPRPDVRYELAVPQLYLTPELAVPIGMILHELVSNALCHGMGQVGGRLRVAFEQSDEGQLVLSVSDPGALGPDAHWPDRGLGFTLVSALVRQIGGTMAFARGTEGTEVRVFFAQLIAP